jgi:cyclic pyranopterin phosphate synthase
MVDIAGKPVTKRTAVAWGLISLGRETLKLIQENKVAKGNVFAVAKVAGILAAKKTAGLIPLCHSLNLTQVDLNFEFREEGIGIESRVELEGRTGAEMEALTAVAVAALTIYDMCKSVDRGMTISGIKLIKKTGGRSALQS